MKLSKGQVLYRQGDTANSLYIIQSGKIGLFKSSPKGPVEIATLEFGQIIGDLSFFTGAPRSSDAIAMTDCECRAVSYDVVRSQFDAIPAWIQSIT
jgi:CRP/FNR family cyclic AMP-dependent transcriptional regulator